MSSNSLLSRISALEVDTVESSSCESVDTVSDFGEGLSSVLISSLGPLSSNPLLVGSASPSTGDASVAFKSIFDLSTIEVAGCVAGTSANSDESSFSDTCGMSSVSLASDVRGEATRESGSGIDEGERDLSAPATTLVSDGERLSELDVVVPVASEAERIFARNRSSKFFFCRGFSEEIAGGADVALAMGWPVRCDVRDMRKFEMADSASWLEDVGGVGLEGLSTE